MALRKKKENIRPWVCAGREVDSLKDFPEGTFGFVYELVSRETGKRYVGKKQLYSYHTKISKVFNEKTKRWNKVREITSTESNWQQYFGSSVEVKNLIKEEGKENFERYILALAPNKKVLTYLELHYQCNLDVLRDSRYINSNILGKFFRSDFQ